MYKIIPAFLFSMWFITTALTIFRNTLAFQLRLQTPSDFLINNLIGIKHANTKTRNFKF